MKISDLILNDVNPRYIKDNKFKSLVNSIESFPKMMELRPIVIDEKNVVLGGNMRLRAIIEIGLVEIPDEWVKYVDDLTSQEKDEFIIKDNVSYGEWDFELLANDWNENSLVDWGLDLPNIENIVDEKDFENKFNAISDTNCDYPIVPQFDEDAECFIIISHSEVDSNWLREKLNMQKMKGYKRSEYSKSNIIDIKDLKNVI